MCRPTLLLPDHVEMRQVIHLRAHLAEHPASWHASPAGAAPRHRKAAAAGGSGSAGMCSCTGCIRLPGGARHSTVLRPPQSRSPAAVHLLCCPGPQAPKMQHCLGMTSTSLPTQLLLLNALPGMAVLAAGVCCHPAYPCCHPAYSCAVTSLTHAPGSLWGTGELPKAAGELGLPSGSC